MVSQEGDDLEKLKFYLEGKFEFQDSVLFSNLVKKPTKQELSNLMNKIGKHEVERLYNHFQL